MQNRNVFFLFLFFLLVLPFWGSANITPQKKILVLDSYHDGLSWSDDLVKAIKKEMLSNHQSIQLYIEYMDTKRIFSQEHLNKLYQLYQNKYKDIAFDLIISTDDNAYDFLLKHRMELFGDVPCFFCGLNKITPTPDDYRGVFEITNVNATLNLIKSFHPKFKRITVVGDYSTTGILSVKNFIQTLKNRKDSIPYRIITPPNLETLRSEISHLGEGDILFFLLYNRDKEGNFYSYEESFNLTTPSCKVPIYCIRDFYMNRGAVGGMLTTAQMQGQMVALMANRYLEGTPLQEIISQTAPQQLILDYKQLKRFGIKKKLIPPDAHIINRPFKFIRENKQMVILTLTIFVLLILVIISLSIIIHSRQLRIRRELQHMEVLRSNQEKLEIAKQKAEESNRLKSAFLANMSHEIRTPMNAIMGFSELLSDPERSEENRLRYIGIIQKNTKFLLRLINDILDISKIETNQLIIVKEDCKLSDLLNNLLENYRSFLKQSESETTLQLVTEEIDNLEKIHTDCTRLSQILSNLLENAIKFTPHGSIQFGYERQENQILFFVKDTGIGISPEKKEIIFDRFRQAEMDADTRKYGGTGLGLAISKSLVELLGGKIWLESAENQGTTFYFTIPLTH